MFPRKGIFVIIMITMHRLPCLRRLCDAFHDSSLDSEKAPKVTNGVERDNKQPSPTSLRLAMEYVYKKDKCLAVSYIYSCRKTVQLILSVGRKLTKSSAILSLLNMIILLCRNFQIDARHSIHLLLDGRVSGNVKEILDKGLDYMSTEESSDDSVTLYMRGLPWLKQKYSNSLKALNKVHFNGLSAKSKGMVKRREEGEASVPCNVLQFAVDENEDPADLNSSVTSTEGMN